MVKVLRKYNRSILAVGGVLLMIAFLVPQAIESFKQNPENQTYATLGGRRISAAAIQRSAKELDALQSFSPLLMGRILGIERTHGADHWLLLTTEAEKAGLIGEDQDGEDWMPELTEVTGQAMAQQQYGRFYQQIMNSPQFRQMRDELFKQAAKNVEEMRVAATNHSELFRGRDELFYHSLARARGVYRLIQSYAQAPRFSDRQTLLTAKHDLDGAMVDYVFVNASNLAAEVPDPDAQALQAHFDRFKDLKPGDAGGPDDVGLGYNLPARVKVEWLKLDKAAIEASIMPDAVEVFKRWRKENPSKDKAEFSKDKVRVESEIKSETATKVMDEANQVIRAAVLSATRRLDADGDYKKLPADWETSRPKLEAIAQNIVEQVKKNLGLNTKLPEVTTRTGEWLTAADLGKLPGIGQASVRVMGSQNVPFSQAATSVRELAGGNVLRSQLGVTEIEWPVSDQQGNRYYYTVLAARAESAPDSMDEIKADVLKDYKRLQAFEKLKADAPDLVKLAISDGLKGVAESVKARTPEPAAKDANGNPITPPPPPAKIDVPIRERQDVTRTRFGAPDDGMNTQTVRDAIMDAAQKLDPMTPYDQLDAQARTLAVPVPSKLALAIVRITANRPLTAEKYRTYAESEARQAGQQELSEASAEASSSPFSYKRLAERHGYKLERAGAKSDETDDETTPAKPKA